MRPICSFLSELTLTDTQQGHARNGNTIFKAKGSLDTMSKKVSIFKCKIHFRKLIISPYIPYIGANLSPLRIFFNFKCF